MAEHDDGVEEKTIDKHNWGAADLEKVTDYQEDKDDMTTDNVDHLKAETENTIQLLTEDIDYLVKAFELKKPVAERLLIEARGDFKKCYSKFVLGK